MICMVGVIMGSPLRMPPTRSHLYLGASSTVSGSVVSLFLFGGTVLALFIALLWSGMSGGGL
jgi:hypothetical protein